MYKIITRFLGESEIYYDSVSSFAEDKNREVYNLADFMRPESDCAWYHGYMPADNFSRYVIKLNKNCDSVKIFYQYQIYIPDEVVKATSKK